MKPTAGVVRRFAGVAERVPECIAVRAGESGLTYGSGCRGSPRVSGRCARRWCRGRRVRGSGPGCRWQAGCSLTTSPISQSELDIRWLADLV